MSKKDYLYRSFFLTVGIIVSGIIINALPDRYLTGMLAIAGCYIIVKIGDYLIDNKIKSDKNEKE